MKKFQGSKIAVLIATILGIVSDSIAIIHESKFSLSTIFLVILFLVLFAIAIYTFILLYKELKKSFNFTTFIQYLESNPYHNFNLLPKLCLELNKRNAVNPLHINHLKISYTIDMPSDPMSVLPNQNIEYNDTVEVLLSCQNKSLPDNLKHYRGNEYASSGKEEIFVKYGTQTDYHPVNANANNTETHYKTDVKVFQWYLSPKNISHDKEFPVSLKMNYTESGKANWNDTIIFYPRQYGERVDEVELVLQLQHPQKVLTKFNAYRIWKDGNAYTRCEIPDVTIENNTAHVKFLPNNNKDEYEAFYFRPYWNLTNDSSD